MKRHELGCHLQRHGCRLEREGSRHTIYANPSNGAKAPVPRHAEIDNRLARKICQPLAIESVIAFILIFAAIYFIAKYWRRAQGRPLDMAFKEIPPE